MVSRGTVIDIFYCREEAASTLARSGAIRRSPTPRWHLVHCYLPTTTPCAQWHVESANGLMDLMMLADNVFQLTAA
jgi:hypothetical protein